MAEAPRPTRRSLVGGLGVAGLMMACTTDPDQRRAPRTRPGTRPQEAEILDLAFEITEQFRPFALVAPGFEAVDLRGVEPGSVVLADDGPPAPYAAMQARLGAGDGTVSLGLATNDDEHVLVRWSSATGRVTLEVRRAGRTRVLRRRKVAMGAGSGLAFALCENQVTGLVDDGTGWRPVVTERRKVRHLVDLRRPEVLDEHRYTWRTDGVGLEHVRAGVFGMTGLRDPHLVQHADGTPYRRDGRCYMTWTCAGLGFFQQAHWSVWSFDPDRPTDMRLESQLFSRRDGVVVGDHAGQIVRDGDRWLVATSAWGDFEPGSIHVRHTETTADLVSGIHLLETEPTALPTKHGSWDPSLTRIDGAWHVAYVESPSQKPFRFHPALASTDAATWHESLEPVAAATRLYECEGPIIATVGDETWLLASDGRARRYPVYDLTGQRAGYLDAPYPTNIPHPQLVPRSDGRWSLVTFDGTPYGGRVTGYGGHGDVVVMDQV